MKNNVALIIVFNHRYDKNIKTLERLYENKFSNIYFLVPFYDGTQPNVIPVYENSYFFEGYLAQGFKHYFKEDYEHYFFVADDMILNPAMNEDNYASFFKLQNGYSFIPEVFSLHNFSNDDTLLFAEITAKGIKKKNYWWRVEQAVPYSTKLQGVECQQELPTYEDAGQKLKQHGFEMKPLHYTDVYGGIYLSPSRKEMLKRRVKYFFKRKKHQPFYQLPYPMVASYSDIVIVHKDTIRKFIQYCGAFAATELFVEFAIPTALLLATDKVATQPSIGKQGVLYWNYYPDQIEKYNQDMERYGYELSRLLANFPADKLYMHPIKLSKWKTELPDAT